MKLDKPVTGGPNGRGIAVLRDPQGAVFGVYHEPPRP
ncbi:VOC family protein [Streptomyces sp. bgisy027]